MNERYLFSVYIQERNVLMRNEKVEMVKIKMWGEKEKVAFIISLFELIYLYKQNTT